MPGPEAVVEAVVAAAVAAERLVIAAEEAAPRTGGVASQADCTAPLWDGWYGWSWSGFGVGWDGIG